MTDAFNKICDICNECRLHGIKGKSEHQVVAISKQFEKEIIEALHLRELNRSIEMMQFFDPTRMNERVPKSLSGHVLLGVTISVYE